MFHYDPYSWDIQDDPYPYYRILRDKYPAYYVESLDSFSDGGRCDFTGQFAAPLTACTRLTSTARNARTVPSSVATRSCQSPLTPLALPRSPDNPIQPRSSCVPINASRRGPRPRPRVPELLALSNAGGLPFLAVRFSLGRADPRRPAPGRGSPKRV